LNHALFAILVSQVEGPGMVTREAAAMGRASLLTAVPGSIDLLPQNSSLLNGLKFGQVIELADALEEWFRNPALTLKEGQNFFASLASMCNPERVANKYERACQLVIQN
jgi:glycosyltransferase involved in cell wall biosynthesis